MTTITLKGKPIKVVGTRPTQNQTAPHFSLYNLDNELINIEDFRGNKVLISVFPDINTRICDLQTRRIYTMLQELPNLKILNISNNTVDQLKDWCLLQDIEMTMLVDEKATFAHAYGVWMDELEKLARSVFVLDEEGKLIYDELVTEMAQEPDYKTLLKYLK